VSELGESMGVPGRFCRNCGRQLGPAARFCADCGETTSSGSQPATAAGAETGSIREPEAAAAAAGIAERDTSSRSWPPAAAGHPGTLDALPGRESPGDAGVPPGDDGPRTAWPGRPLIVGLAVFVVAGLAAVVIFVFHPFGQHSPAPAAQPPTPVISQASPTPTPTFSSSSPSAAQAAQNLAALLAQSVSDRRSIDHAYNDATKCGPGLDQDSRTFRNAASSRQQLLGRLAGMPGRSALSGQMLGDLTSAWRASVEADQDYAKWARDLVSAGCVGGNPTDPHFVAAKTPNLHATADKRAFVRQWNPLAAQYGLTGYWQSNL
jgi:hypothetical protein